MLQSRVRGKQILSSISRLHLRDFTTWHGLTTLLQKPVRGAMSKIYWHHNSCIVNVGSDSMATLELGFIKGDLPPSELVVRAASHAVIFDIPLGCLFVWLIPPDWLLNSFTTPSSRPHRLFCFVLIPFLWSIAKVSLSRAANFFKTVRNVLSAKPR